MIRATGAKFRMLASTSLGIVAGKDKAEVAEGKLRNKGSGKQQIERQQSLREATHR